MKLKLDWIHVVAPFIAAGAVGSFDYMQNSADPFSKPILEHAAIAFFMVIAALLKQSPIAPPVKS
jgi:hypothetical protein